jgi:P-aminobenzoate N-oxygenase AurF
MKTLTETAQRLSEASNRDAGNLADVLSWPEKLSQVQWFMSPELLSIYGNKSYANLTDDQRKVLSFFECVNLFSLNIHGERMLIEGIARRLYKESSADIAQYLHHFLDEENKHMSYFGGFCTRYAKKIYPSKHVSLPRQFAKGEEDFLFFTKVFIFEEIIDKYNVHIMLDEKVNELARRINYLHHKDEARHLVFGRKVVLDLFERYAPAWSDQELERVREQIAGYALTLQREFFNPSVYRDAGLEDPYGLAETAFSHPAARLRRQKMSRPSISMLVKNGILTEEICL